MKVLIISHNPLTDQSNMGKTLSSLFCSFPPEELCQLYIYPTVPNVKRCGSFFRITDKEALTAAFTRTCPGGEMETVDSGAGVYETEAEAQLYRSRYNHSPIRRLLRDEMWRHSGWYSRKLQDWLAAQNPDIIFVAPGGAKFLYDFALKIADALRIPIVTYLCDEHYFLKTPKGILSRWQHQLLKRKMEALLASTSHLVTICPELSAPYAARFAVPATVLMTGTEIPGPALPRLVQFPTQISYFGNIRCGRYRSLAEVGRELAAINREQGKNYRLKIYTAEQDPAILSALKKYASVELPGFLSGDAFVSALQNAQLLLHTEAFGSETVEQVKHSISTKIADSLASGIPLLAYGPGEVASMMYLQRNSCAIMATTQQDLRDMLLTAFTNSDMRQQAAEAGLRAAKTFHDAKATSQKLRDIFEEML